MIMYISWFLFGFSIGVLAMIIAAVVYTSKASNKEKTDGRQEG